MFQVAIVVAFFWVGVAEKKKATTRTTIITFF
jgi:hypothetical protein